MDPEVHYVTDRDAGIALITGQIVEAWISRLPRASNNISPVQMAAMIVAVRTSLSQPVEGSESSKPSRTGRAPTPLRPVS